MAQVFHVLEARQPPRLLSIVIPLYCEQEMIAPLRRELSEFMDAAPCTVELILINDGSSDHTLPLLLDWAKDESRVRVLGLARNFGHQAAVTAGLDEARGDAVVIMDADLQDPPAIVLKMIEEYCRGYDVVFGQRVGRTGEGSLKRLTAWAFYRFMRSFIHRDLPADTGDFRLISRRALDALRSMRETHRFLRGMVAWVGFAQTAVPFTRPARLAGTTKYPMRKMIRFAWTAACSFSTAPLRLSLFIGILVALFGLGAGAWAIATKLVGYTERGWTSLMAVFCIVGGTILFSIGVLGEYIGRIFEEIKGRPLYIVSQRVNFEEPSPEFPPSVARDIPTAAHLASPVPVEVFATALPNQPTHTARANKIT